MTNPYDEHHRRIASIQSRLDNTIESLRNNSSLSDRGRRAEMARATVNAKQMVDRLKTEVVTARNQERERLEMHLFGLASDQGGIAAARDAADRADKIEGPDVAAAALKRAQLMSDKSMQRAIAYRATTKGWNNVVDQYVDGLGAEGIPTALSLQKLAEIPGGPGTNLADAAVFRVREPRELLGADIEHLASDAAPEQQQQASAGPVGGSYF
ncbi:hypothetical protein [Mycolicibacterium sphagni]|uniref:Uncharacterized protein n=1 Tax=Mycolicibacterium sphagni TaxID=1786 RepID=A0A255DHH3_9MYCO|nr:hypothetical protein [Mycolicibacterium sphagni]OYN78897.1 hypothetical protein CG716_13595 [Mycolicibacterium sphagni]